MDPDFQDTPAPKEDHAKVSMQTNTPALKSETSVEIKDEQADDDGVDSALAIFEDVDEDNSEEEGPELVDNDHVGFVEHNGVNCWVCPGSHNPKPLMDDY